MRWWIFAPAMALALSMDMTVMQVLAVNGCSPRLWPTLLAFVAMYASRAVPAAGVERFSTLMRNALGEAGVRERFAAFGVTPEPSTPAQLREFTRGEIARWGDVVRSRGITLS